MKGAWKRRDWARGRGLNIDKTAMMSWTRSSVSLHLTWRDDRGKLSSGDSLSWIFHSWLHSEMAERHYDTSQPCSPETSLSLAVPWPEVEAAGRRSQEEIKVEIVLRRRAKRKLILRKLRVYLWSSGKIKALGLCCWELLWWIFGNGVLMDERCRPVLGSEWRADTTDSTTLISDRQKITASPASVAPTTLFNSRAKLFRYVIMNIP